MRKENLNSVINWICAALACFALMVSMNADLSGINAEAAGGGLWTLLAANIKKLLSGRFFCIDDPVLFL